MIKAAGLGYDVDHIEEWSGRKARTIRRWVRGFAAREAWLPVIWLATYSPELSKKEREWRHLTRDVRGHLARKLRSFVDEIIGGLPADLREQKTFIRAPFDARTYPHLLRNSARAAALASRCSLVARRQRRSSTPARPRRFPPCRMAS